jgi:uncharacterized protein
MKILLDTNFLLVPVQFKVDIFSELSGELYTTSSCIAELEKLSSTMEKDAAAARVALTLVKEKGVKIIETTGNADASLVTEAEKGYVVATNDKILIKKLKSNAIKVLRLKQKKYIITD